MMKDFSKAVNLFSLKDFDFHEVEGHEGWFRNEPDPTKRAAGMQHYFDTILEGYKSETTISDEFLNQLPIFIDMVLIENIVDEFECAAREGEEVDFEDIEEAVNHLIKTV